MRRPEADEDDLSEHDERRHLRARSDKRGGRDRRALVGVGRPEMEGSGRDLEGKTDQGHNDSGRQQRLDRQRH